MVGHQPFDQFAVRRQGRRAAVEVVQEIPQIVQRLAGQRGFQSLPDGRVDFVFHLALDFLPQRSQLDLDPTVASHHQRRAHFFHAVVVVVQIHQSHELVEGRPPLARLPQPVGHQPQVGCPMLPIIQQPLDFVALIAICGEVGA